MNITDAVILLLVLCLVYFILEKVIKEHKSANKSKCSMCSGCPSKKFCGKNQSKK